MISHDRDPRHVEAMKLWSEREIRDQQESTIVHKISDDSEHRQWLETIFLLIKALVKHGLPLRVHVEHTDFEEGVSGGLFLDLLGDVVFKFRPDLLQIAKKLPKNAKYTSPDISPTWKLSVSCASTSSKTMLEYRLWNTLLVWPVKRSFG